MYERVRPLLREDRSRRRKEDHSMQSLRRHFLILTTLLAAMIAAGAMAASGAGTVKLTNCNKASSRPKQVTLTCGDGNTALSGLRWSSFGGASANASGTFEMNTC